MLRFCESPSAESTPVSNQQNESKLVAPEYLSPSSIGTFRQCPLKFKYSKIDGLPDPSGPEAILGNFVHDVLEELYKLPSEMRTQAQARQLARELWSSQWEEKASRVVHGEKELNRFRWSAWWCIENLWVLEDPSTFNPSKMECFVTGSIGGVKMRGYIDRLSIDEKSVTISDYKTGKTPRQTDLQEKFFQLITYSQLLSHIGVETDDISVELLYLKDGVRFKQQVTTEDLNTTIETIKETKRNIDESCKSGYFQHRKSILCNWCSFKKICPAWGNDGRKNN